MSTEQLSMSMFASRADYDAAVLAQRVEDLEAENAKFRQWLAESNERAEDYAGRVLKLDDECDELKEERDTLRDLIAAAIAELAERREPGSASDWTKVAETPPAEGQEVTVRMSHGQIRQVVKDSGYSGGWKQVNCRGWECVSFDPSSISHWRSEIFARPSAIGPTDAPWMLAAAPEAAR